MSAASDEDPLFELVKLLLEEADQDGSDNQPIGMEIVSSQLFHALSQDWIGE